MRYTNSLLSVLVLASVAGSAIAGPISDVTDKLLAKTPEAAFDEAVAKNDLRLLTIPFCDDVAPGFDFRAYKGKDLQNNDLGIACHTLLGDDEMKALFRLEDWVAKYNALMFEKLAAAR